MTGPSTLVLLLAGLVPGAPAAGDPSEHVTLTVEASPVQARVGERVEVSLHIQVDTEWFGAHAVPSFARRADLSLRVEAPWLEGQPGSVRWTPMPPAEGAGAVSLALNDEIVRGAAGPAGGRRAVTLRFATFAPGPGPLVVGPTALRFSWCEAFDSDVFGEPVPVDTRVARVEAVAPELTVVALPEAGRPADFSGYVGRARLSAFASAEGVSLGETLRFSVRIEGDGDLSRCLPPDLERLAGCFEVLGRIDVDEPGARTFTWELVPVAPASAIPALPFSWFETGPDEGYRTLTTPEVPLEVRGTVPQASDDGPSSDSEHTEEAPAPLLPVVAAGLVLLLVVGALRLRASGAPGTARESGGGAAASALSALGEPGSDPVRILEDYLAARLDRPAPALLDPSLASWLEARGASGEAAREAAELHGALVRSRYGGERIAGASERVRRTIEALERAPGASS